MKFEDRHQAGRLLGERLAADGFATPGLLVLALPRGGVPVGLGVARALGAELDVLVARKLGMPGQEELAFGAVAEGDELAVNLAVVDRVPRDLRWRIAERERAEVRRRALDYREARPPPPVEGRAVIVVDDGLATGATMLAAVRALRRRAPRRLVVAVPVAARETVADLAGEADRVIALLQPETLFAVGAWYEDFSQTTDGDVRAILRARRDELPATPPPG